MGGLIFRVGVIGAIVVGGLVFRQWLSGNASDLQIGDCFDPPTTVDTVVRDVQHHPCSDAHRAEVFYVADYDAPSSGYPDQKAFESWVLDRCIGAFQGYVGRSYQDAEELDIQPFWPTQEGWGKGDKEMTCFIVRVDNGTMTSSVRATAQ